MVGKTNSVRLEEPDVKIVSWSNGSEQDIEAMIEAHNKGIINIYNYWSVGDVRRVALSSMSASGVGESHVAQTVEFVLMDKYCDGFTITSTGKKPCFIVGMRNCLANDSAIETGYMNSSQTSANGWSGSARRTWCNNIFRNAVPSSLRNIFKQFTWKTGRGGSYTSGTRSTDDYFALPVEKVIFGTANYSQSDEANLYSIWEWYENQTNRIKSNTSYWTASSRSGSSGYFVSTYSNGTPDYYSASSSLGISPFGCI